MMKLIILFLFVNSINLLNKFNNEYVSYSIPTDMFIENEYSLQESNSRFQIINAKDINSNELNSFNIAEFRLPDNDMLEKEEAQVLVNSLKEAFIGTNVYQDFIVLSPSIPTNFGPYLCYEFLFTFKLKRDVGLILCSGSIIVLKSNYTAISIFGTHSNNKTISFHAALKEIEQSILIK